MSKTKKRKTEPKQRKEKEQPVISGTPVTDIAVPTGWTKAKHPTGKFYKFTEFGQELVGVFQGVEPSKKKNYADSLRIETVDGMVLVPASFDLEQIFTHAKIKEGTAVKIIFIDAIPLKNGKHMKKFEVLFKKGK